MMKTGLRAYRASYIDLTRSHQNGHNCARTMIIQALEASFFFSFSLWLVSSVLPAARTRMNTHIEAFNKGGKKLSQDGTVFTLSSFWI